MSPRQHLHKGSTPVCSSCFPTLLSVELLFPAPIPVQGRLREWLFPLPSHNWHSVYWDAVWPAVNGKTYSWLLALQVTCVSTEAFWDFHLL